jgi:biopolymer transport protein TolQ
MFALAVAAAPGTAPGIVGLFLESGWMGKVIMGLLLCFSIVSWATILLKYQYLRRAEKESHAFLAEFRRTKDTQDLLKFAGTKRYSPVASLFLEGYRETEAILSSLPGGKVVDNDVGPVTEEIERALRMTTQDEVIYMERYLAFLGTTGTVGPLLGLFGTVWGIMDAFYGIGLKGSGDLGALAPGLAEALINTSGGLFVAIPAVIAYNYFAEKIRDIATRMDSFSIEFLSFVNRTHLRKRV